MHCRKGKQAKDNFNIQPEGMSFMIPHSKIIIVNVN